MAVKDYIGIYYSDKGRTRGEGVDCWGLVRLYYMEEFGIALPSYTECYPSADEINEVAAHIENVKGLWEPIKYGSEQVGDVIIIRIKGQPTHVGVIIDSFRKRMLHSLKGHDSVIEKYTAPLWKNRVEGFVRHQNLTEVLNGK